MESVKSQLQTRIIYQNVSEGWVLPVGNILERSDPFVVLNAALGNVPIALSVRPAKDQAQRKDNEDLKNP
jgi:predicted aconitase with swiveling domain